MWTRNVSDSGWVGVDLDGTLAEYDSGQWPNIGEPVPAMVAIVKQLLEEGREVRIVTARVGHLFTAHATDDQFNDATSQHMRVQVWCKKHLGVRLDVTAVKDYDMAILLDDRAVTVEKNTGRVLTPGWKSLL